MKLSNVKIMKVIGITACPTGILVKEASSYPCDVTIEKEGKKVDAKRIFGIMGLGVKCGETIILRTDGEEEEKAMESLEKFIEKNL